MLGDFFDINLPYGISRNEKDEWYAFNREYVPIGFNNEGAKTHIEKLDLPLYTKYEALTDKKLLAIADNDPKRIKRDEGGKICMVWLYDTGTNPMNQTKGHLNLQLWNKYFQKLKLLSKLLVSEKE
ncbi:hypothetical protein [Spirosoma sp.]|uniref:hypothetical protein n=1 Tax=Spirosoma sp. TaxID=1899569 RepID=UPI00260B9178|nr:hypothetical protein [Spirosoma sp.]MCX6216512.1 hypothetical protein [Spirosoma sp.]